MYKLDVLIANTPLSIDHPFTYLCDSKVEFGALVKVDFAHRNALGFVVDASHCCEGELDLKKITEVVNDHAFTHDQYSYASWLASVGYKPLNQILNQMVIQPLRKQLPFTNLLSVSFILNKQYDGKLTAKQRECVSDIGNNEVSEIQLLHKFKKSFLKSCVDKGILIKRKSLPSVEMSHPLNCKSRDIVEYNEISTLVINPMDQFDNEIEPIVSLHLLDNKRVLILVPNDVYMNSITNKIDKLYSHCVYYSSNLSNNDKLKAVYALQQRANLVVATQSILLIDCNYDLIIVMDSSNRRYEYESYFHVSLQRCLTYLKYKYRTHVIYASNTPSLMQVVDSNNVKYGDGTYIKPIIVDMEHHYRSGKGLLSRPVLQAVLEAINNNEKVYVWVNRKGSYHVVQCAHCHNVLICEKCGRLLTYSDKDNAYHCYTCNLTKQLTHCPTCNSTQFNYSIVGVERIAKLLQAIFPNANITTIDREKDVNLETIKRSNIIVGTNAILSYPFAKWECFVGIDVDAYFSGKDFQQNEHAVNDCFNLMRRTTKKIILQFNDIHHPYVPFIENNDYFGFVRFELSYRKQNKLPPYSAQASFTFNLKNEDSVLLKTMECVDTNIQIYGPSWIDKHTCIYQCFSQNSAVLDQFVEYMYKKNKNIWKNNVEVKVGPYNR